MRFARIFADGCVLQRGKEIHVWGFAEGNEQVEVALGDNTTVCKSDENGRFDAVFPAQKKGGPYTLTATGKNGSEAVSRNVMIGELIVICGQSNMEFPMERVRETYPDEWKAPDDPMFRTFKVMEKPLFKKSIPDVETGEWKSLSSDTIDAYSAVGYFTAKYLRKNEDVAVGLVDLTMGGAPIEAFMSEESLAGFDEALSEAERLGDDDTLNAILANNESGANEWHAALDGADVGLNSYEDGKAILEKGRDIVLPDFFSDTELDGLIGSVWIAKTFTVPEKYEGKSATLWFGTLVDFDFCYINGQLVGNTEYTYPPRRYKIPEGLIREGENTVVFRIGVEKGYGRVTPGKLFGIVYGDDTRRISDGFNESLEGAEHIEYLAGVWKYLIGSRCEKSPDPVFVSWKPTALYNGMLEPLTGLNTRAFAFYQGESNCRNNHEYRRLTERFVRQIRDMWGADIPYICVELPEFNARMEEITYDGGKAWRGLVAAQEDCTDIPGFYLIRSYGTGELNDLHPQRKAPVGQKIAETITKLIS